MGVVQFHMSTILGYEDALALLVWLFELPPSVINVKNSVVTVACTEEVLHVYNLCTTSRPYRFSAPKVIHSREVILLRQENPYTYKIKGKNYTEMTDIQYDRSYF